MVNIFEPYWFCLDFLKKILRGKLVVGEPKSTTHSVRRKVNT